MLTVAQVLEVVCTAIPIDEVNVMGIPDDDPYASEEEPLVWGDFRRILVQEGLDLELEEIPKWDFYEAVASDEHVLTIQTGDQALFANVLLSIGVRQ
jgi:L-fucose mutarotase